MADIDRLPSELEVGVFSDNLLATQLDTIERVQSLYGPDFNVPEIKHTPIIPKNLDTDDIVKGKTPPIDYLTSTDPKLRQLAKDAMEQDAQKNLSLTRGFGLPNMVRYQEGQEKFTDDHWWSEAGKTKFGFDPYKTLAQNEDYYHQNVWNEYSLFGKGWRTIGTFAGRTLSKLTTGLIGMVGDVGSMAWNGMQELVESVGGPKNNFWADVSDNWLARTMEEADQYTKNQILPTYKAINYDDKGAFSKLTDPYFWSNDIADGAGFLLQFAIPSMLLGKAAQLGKLGHLGRFGRVMSTGVGQLPTASSLQKGLGATLELLTGSRNVGGISAHVFNTTMESLVEAKEGFHHTVEELMRKGYTRDEAQNIAAENAPSQFGMNMAILSFSNAFENKWFQRAAGNRLNPYRARIDDAGLLKVQPGNLVGKFFANNKWGNRLYFYGGDGAKAALMEGYWEENAQLAAQRVASGMYTRRGDDTLSEGLREKAYNFFSQYIKQTKDAWNRKDREAADSIMAGAVIGILGGTAFNRLSGDRGEIKDFTGAVVKPKTFFPEGARRQRIRDNAEIVARVKNARDAWLSINVMPADLHTPGTIDSPGIFDQEKAKQRVEEINEKLHKVASVLQRKMDLDTLTDQDKRESLQHLLFGDYVKAHIMNGTGEALVNRLKNWSSKSAEELQMYGVDVESIEDPIYWANVAQQLINEYKRIDRIKYANTTDETISGYSQKERALKSLIFDYISVKQSAERTAQKYAQLEMENDPFKSVDTFNSYNKLIARREMLKATIDSSETLEQNKAYFQKHLDEVNSQIEMRKKSLPEHQTGNVSDMVFEIGTDVDAQEDEIFSSVNEFLGFQHGKEQFQLAAKEHDKMIREYSDPSKGIEYYNKVVDYWNEHASKLRISKLKDLGYTQAEIVKMTEPEQIKLIEANVPKETAKEEVTKEPTIQEYILSVTDKADLYKMEGVREFVENTLLIDPDASLNIIQDALRFIQISELPSPTVEQLAPAVLTILKSFDPNITDTNLFNKVKRLMEHMADDPTIEIPGTALKILAAYIKAHNDTIKQDIAKESEDIAKKTEEKTVTPEAEVVVKTPVTPIEAPRVEKEEPKQEEPTEETGTILPPPPPAPPAPTPDESFINEVREAFRLQSEAVDNNTTFKDEAEKEGMKLHNNRVDNHIDNGKNEGRISIITSNPRELKDGAVDSDNNNISRFHFMDNLLSGKLGKDDFKLVLSVGKGNSIYGVVADKNGKILTFNEKGFPTATGMPILFYLDYDMFTKENISKRRSDVIQPGFAVAPLTATPIELHPSFQNIDIIETLRNRIKQTTVTASMDFVTQGLLFRPGVTNGYATIPKNIPTHTASSLFSKGHMVSEKGNIELDSIVINGVYRQAMRIQFQLYKNINNKAEGYEVVEFRPVAIKDAKNEDGNNISNSLVEAFQKGIQGNLDTSVENLSTLRAILRPDLFLVLDLGAKILIVDRKKFEKSITLGNFTIDKLRSLTKLEDILNSPLNISRTLYDSNEQVTMLGNIVGYGRENYSRFINMNVATSAETIRKSSDSQGYARINKRIAITVDENMDELIKTANQKEQENKSPNVTQVDAGVDLSDTEKKDILKTEINPEDMTGLDDLFTKKNC